MLAALIVLTLLPLLIFLRIRERKLSAAGMISENTLPSVLFLLKNRNVQECSTNTKNTNAEEASAESEETTNG
jgi:hypothetical protein